MKRIALLSIIFIAIGIFTYHYEEKGGLERLAQEESKHQIIDESFLGELKEIKASKFSLKKEGEHFRTSKGVLVDDERLQKYLEILGKMKVRRFLKADERNPLFFPKDAPVLRFVFAKGYAIFKLGEKLEFDQSFYMEVNQNGVVKQMIAYDSSANEGTYDKSTFHKNPEKYLRFKTMILLDENFFIDTHLFQEEYVARKVDWISLELQNNNGSSFKLEIPERKIIPSPSFGLQEKQLAFQEYISELVNFTGYGWMEKGELSHQIASLVIKRKSGKVKTIKIYKSLNGKSGYFAHSIEENKILTFSKKALKAFLKKEKEFWVLKGIKNKEPAEIVLGFPDGKKAAVRLKYGKVFEAFSTDKVIGEAVNTTFKSLIDVFSSEADELTPLNGEESLNNNLFVVSWGGEAQEFYVMLDRGELLLANKKMGYMLHYRLTDLSNFGKGIKDFFIKK